MSDFDAIDIIEEKLNSNKVNALCEKIFKFYEQIWCLSLRKCEVEDNDFEKILRNCRNCKNLTYLNLSVNILTSLKRVKVLESCLPSFTNLNTICLYSSELGDEGLKLMFNALSAHTQLTSVDLGDCKLTDKSVDCINSLIYIDDNNKWAGLEELGLSGNELITPTGWYQILLAVSASSRLKCFYADYNNIDDICGYLFVAIIAASGTLETVDLEHTKLTDASAKLFCYLIENYPVTVKSLNLVHNDIQSAIVKKIEGMLSMNASKSPSLEELPKQPQFRRDSSKLDDYIRNAKDFKAKMSVANEANGLKPSLKYPFKSYESAVGRDGSGFKLNVKNPKQSYTSIIQRKTDEDLLEPVDDLRFKRHDVLPFNLKN